MSSRGPTATALPGRGCGSLVAQAAAMKNPHLPTTEPCRGESRQPLNKSTCMLGVLGHPKGDSRLLSGFWPPKFPTFAWRATENISAEVFSMTKTSAWRSLVETATSIKTSNA